MVRRDSIPQHRLWHTGVRILTKLAREDTRAIFVNLVKDCNHDIKIGSEGAPEEIWEKAPSGGFAILESHNNEGKNHEPHSNQPAKSEEAKF